jgi:hypothetical protein
MQKDQFFGFRLSYLDGLMLDLIATEENKSRGQVICSLIEQKVLRLVKQPFLDYTQDQEKEGVKNVY